MLNSFVIALFLSLLVGTAMTALVAGYQIGKESHNMKTLRCTALVNECVAGVE